ncbi:DNA polymerase III subunit gamma and tau [Mariniluteicoccus flavus]
MGHGFEPFDQGGASLLGGDEPEPAPAPVGESIPGPVNDPAPRGSEAPAAPLALYRRYRPDTFADVIGQEHVTEPLMRALTNNRVNHAYLFSGPRGCGKTTSARILARALNCEKGPRPDPCGECRSCQDLARGGPGSIDVIEIDAASHGGVDDARDLRERAFFAPVHSRYKIYIVDEAHMVTTAGFNALLKLVEEPPPHVKFVFATTEPEKVIGTIRSRTHHYPFRLVPPKVLQAYLGTLCDAEGIAVEQTVLPLVVRAGQGSVRDSLSVLDQLLGGAAESGVSYAQATALLGYTPESLLDEILDAFAAGDAKGVFQAIDKVIEVGQDPRRFGEDLLRRLRDLVIVAAVPDALSSGLIDAADDQGERLASQAAALGAGELTRAAEVIANGLTEMRGTTAPRLHLELMCSRVLLPGADVDDRGVHARLDRLERRIGMASIDGGHVTAAPALPPAQTQQPGSPQEPGSAQPASTPAGPSAPPSGRPDPSAPASATAEPGRSEPPQPTPDRGPQPPARPEPQAPAATPAPAAVVQTPNPPTPSADVPSAPGGGLTTADVRRLWPDVLEEVKGRRRFTWVLISQNAQVHDVTNGVLTLALKNAGARDGFARGGSEDVVRDALVQVLGADLKIQTMVDGGAVPPPGGAPAGRPPAQTRPVQQSQAAQPQTRPAQQQPAQQQSDAAASAPPSAAAPPASSRPSGQAPGGARGPAAPSDWREPDPEPDEDGPPDDAHLAAARPEGDARPPSSSPPSSSPPLSSPSAQERPHDPAPTDTRASAPPATPVPDPAPAAPPERPGPSLSARARQGIRPTRRGPATDSGVATEDDFDEADFTDVPDADAPSTSELLTRHLGAELIAEEDSAP